MRMSRKQIRRRARRGFYRAVHAVLPESWEPLTPAARDFRAATHMRNLTFGAVTESQLVFEQSAAPETGP